jgi:hypothetical protein
MTGTTCVVSARVMLLPLTATAKAPCCSARRRPPPPLTPSPSFDRAVPGSLARDKLKEATAAVVSALVK